MYVYARSSDCLNMFPNNKPSHFFVKLPIVISSDVFSKSALIEVSYPSLAKSYEENVFILTNFVTESCVGYRKYPVIYHLMLGEENANNVRSGDPNYVKLKNIETDIIEVRIVDGIAFQEVEFTPGSIYCTFHFLDVE